MGIDNILKYVVEYGIVFVFIVVYLESLNFPGLAAGVVYPTIGILVLYGKYSLMIMFIVSLVAALLGSITLYILGYYIGNELVNKIVSVFPKLEKNINKALYFSKKYGDKSVLICRFIPAVRTIISLFSGTVRQGFLEFILYSTLGTAICNFILIMSGYITYRAII